MPNRRTAASRLSIRLPWLTMTPLGFPVEPDVYCSSARSAGSGEAPSTAISEVQVSAPTTSRGTCASVASVANWAATPGSEPASVSITAGWQSRRYGRQRSGQAPGPRREARHGDEARVEAGKQRSDVAEAGLEHDQHALARSCSFQQHRRQGSRAAVEQPVGHGLFERLAVAQEYIRQLFALVMRAVPENFDDRAGAPLDVAAHRSLVRASDETTAMSEAPSCIRGVLVPSVRSEPYLNRRIEVQPRCLVTPERRGEGANCARMEPLFAGTSHWFKTGVPIPKFASLCGALACELRNRRTPATY